MINKNLCLIFFLVVPCLLFSQVDSDLNFGVKLGYNNSDMIGEDSLGEKTGYLGNEIYGAFFLEKNLSEKNSLKAEFLFSYTDDYHFIEIPLHYKHKIFKNLYAFGGPKFDFLLDSDENEPYEFNNFGFSLDLGLQYDLSSRFFVEMRYSFGFTEMLIKDYWLDINDAKRNTFRIGVGYKFQTLTKSISFCVKDRAIVGAL